jgi:PIN domain nuclease of toxin-antitoxin system
VLDASAVLALLKGEDGAETVERKLNDSTPNDEGFTALLSTVNLVEIRQYVSAETAAPLEAHDSPIALVDFTVAQAHLAASLREPTRAFGLSLADRACLALGLETDLTVVTAEQEWLKLGLRITVEHIRPWTLT